MSTLRVTNIQDLAGNDVFSLSGGNMTVAGNLTVQGTTTSIETTNLTIEDKNIVLGLTDPAATDVTADGGGITLKGDTDKTIAWNNTSGSWHSNVGVNITSGNLGIGTISPSAPLEISNTSPRIRFNDTDGTNTYSEITATTGAIYLDSRNNTSNGQIILRGLGGGTASEYARLDASGRLLVGTSSALTTFFGTPVNRLAIGGGAAPQVIGCYSANQFGPRLDFVKSRSATVNGQTVVSNNDNLGEFYFGGSDGTAPIPAARIHCSVDGTPGTNDMPGRLSFSTTADGASSPTERMRIDSSGNVGIGTISPTACLDIGKTSVAGVPSIYLSSSNNVNNTSDIALSGNAVIRSEDSLRNVTNTGGVFSWWIGGTDVKAGASGASEMMRISPSGNVGIGTNNPSVLLHLYSGANTTLRLSDSAGSYTDAIYNESGTLSQFIIDADPANTSTPATEILFKIDGSEKLRIKSSGDVGIGTDTPSSRLAVNGSITESTDGGTTYHNVVTAQDIGTAPNEVPLNQFLGQMAFMDEVGDIPTSSSAPQENLSVNFEYVSDTSIKIRMRGSDGVVRSATLTLS